MLFVGLQVEVERDAIWISDPHVVTYNKERNDVGTYNLTLAGGTLGGM